MTEAQLVEEEKQLKADLVIQTTGNRMKNIEFVGMGNSYKRYASVENHAEVSGGC